MYDYCIIGAGIIGTAIARELSKYDLKILVIEKDADVANEQTIANSAIVHAGYDPKPGTLKAQLCVEGNKLFDILEKELEIPLLKTGGFLVARTKSDIERIEEVYERCLQNKVINPHFLNKEQAHEIEPNLTDSVIKVLSLPETKVTYPWEVAFALMENAIKNGAELILNSKVTNIIKEKDYYEIIINDKEKIKTRGIVNACGVFTDVIASYVEKNVPYKINPRKGEYFVLDKAVEGFIHHVLYPIPNEFGKGTLLVPQVHGNILIGPTSTQINARDDLSNSYSELDIIKKNAHLMAKNIPFSKTIRTFAGIRASSTYEDFYIKESIECDNFFHVAGIDSPGLTAAPAIAGYVLNMIVNKIHPLKKDNYDPYRKSKGYFKDLPLDKQKELIMENPKYGRVVCKCEKITEAEVIEAIKGPLGNDTIKGIKKRVRPGSGLCQGGYCEPLVMKIIARETNKSLDKINYYNKDTHILSEKSKGAKR